MKKKIFDIIQIGSRGDLPSRLFDYFISIVIVINISVLFLETFDELSELKSFFRLLEVITILIFCVEYVLRIWTAEYLYPQKTAAGARFKFFCSYDGIVDLLTILPFFFLAGFVVFRLLRVVRIFRLFMINAKDDSFSVITSVLYDKKNQIISSIFIILVLMLASSLCMYSVEGQRQPDVFKNAFSGLWWSMTTIFTVGYGDMYPITVLGRVFAVIITFLGVGVVAIPTGIISAGFVEQYTKAQNSSANYGLSGAKAQTLSVTVTEDSPYIGMMVGEMEDKYNVAVALVLRGELMVLALDNVTIMQDDIILYRELF